MTIRKSAARARLNEAGIEPRGIRASEAAAYLGLSPATFRKYVKEGKLPAPIAGTNRLDRLALDRFIDGVKSESADYDEIMELIDGGQD